MDTVLACFALAGMVGIAPGSITGVTGGLLFALLAPGLYHLTVEDEGHWLAVRFGPLPLFRTGVRYEDIEGVEVGRTTLLDCCGIHWSLRGGWVWSLWGWECIVVRRRRGVLRVGTDDAANLARFLEAKTAQQGT